MCYFVPGHCGRDLHQPSPGDTLLLRLEFAISAPCYVLTLHDTILMPARVEKVPKSMRLRWCSTSGGPSDVIMSTSTPSTAQAITLGGQHISCQPSAARCFSLFCFLYPTLPLVYQPARFLEPSFAQITYILTAQPSGRSFSELVLHPETDRRYSHSLSCQISSCWLRSQI